MGTKWELLGGGIEAQVKGLKPVLDYGRQHCCDKMKVWGRYHTPDCLTLEITYRNVCPYKSN